MTQCFHRLVVPTRGKGLYEATRAIQQWVAGSGIRDGLLTVFIQHTSASLTVQENADRDVIADLNDFFGKIAPEDRSLYRHDSEGPDDMPAHIRAALTQTQITIPVQTQRLCLGTWQGIYVFEHRAQPHQRSLALHIIGD